MCQSLKGNEGERVREWKGMGRIYRGEKKGEKSGGWFDWQGHSNTPWGTGAVYDHNLGIGLQRVQTMILSIGRKTFFSSVQQQPYLRK